MNASGKTETKILSFPHDYGTFQNIKLAALTLSAYNPRKTEIIAMPTISRQNVCISWAIFFRVFLNYPWCIKPEICRKSEMFDKRMVLGVVVP